MELFRFCFGNGKEINMKKSMPYILIVIRALIYGPSYLIVGKLLESTGVFDVLAMRFLLTAIFFLILKLTGIIHISFRGKNLRFLILTALCEPCGYFIFETFGVKGTTTVVTGLLLAMSPVVIIILETLFLKEKTTVLQKLCLLIRIMGGVVVVAFSTSSGKNTVWGIISLVLTMICNAGFCIASRKSSQEFTSFEITFFASVFGAVMFNGINVGIHAVNGTLSTYFAPLFNSQNWIPLLYLSLIYSVIATVMSNYCYAKIQASLAAALGGISTIVTIVVGVLFNHETLYLYHVVGTVMILGGALCMNLLPHDFRKKDHPSSGDCAME